MFVAGVMASRLLCGAGVLASQALRAWGPNGVSVVRSMASGGGVPTDEEQATGLERGHAGCSQGTGEKNVPCLLGEFIALDGIRAAFSLGSLPSRKPGFWEQCW